MSGFDPSAMVLVVFALMDDLAQVGFHGSACKATQELEGVRVSF